MSGLDRTEAMTIMPSTRSQPFVPLALVAASLVFLYRDVFINLVDAWSNDGNYSHGFLILPLAGYLAWERRDKLRAAQIQPSILGLPLILGSMAALVVGILGSEMFVTRVSLVGTLAGGILFLLGWRHLRVLAFPVLVLLLMIPIPAIIFNQIAFPLQLLASRFGETVLNIATIPVLREGNVLILANTSLEVAEACSGIRSLVSLLTLGIVFGYFTDPRASVRTMIALATIPIAIVSNGLRVAGTGIAAHYFGEQAAQGFFHEFSGWIVFLVAFALLLFIQRLIVRLAPAATVPASVAAAA